LATLEAAFAAEPRGKYDVAQWVGWDQFAPGLNGIKCAHGLRAGIWRLTG